jgi:DNA-binding FrmR family transcriptional regulator
MPANVKQDVLMRLKKIEGQIKGLQRMIEEGRDCPEIVHQLAAARKALDKVGFIIFSQRLQECIQEKSGQKNAEKAMEEAMNLFLTLA